MADAKTKTEGEKKTRELKPRPVFMALEGDQALIDQIKAAVASGNLKVSQTTRAAQDVFPVIMGGGAVLEGSMK